MIDWLFPYIKNCPKYLLELSDNFVLTGIDLKIAQVSGDNLFPIRDQLLANDPVQVQEMGMGGPFPKSVHSITAYYGAGYTLYHKSIF